MGRGIFATTPIPAGACVVEMGGTVLRTDELTDDLMALQIGDDLWLCSDGSNPDDFANHSCEPNAGFQYGELRLVALRDIAAGEEITWDYSTSLDEPGWSLDCRCGSSNCRGVILPWRELPVEVRERLWPTALAFLCKK